MVIERPYVLLVHDGSMPDMRHKPGDATGARSESPCQALCTTLTVFLVSVVQSTACAERRCRFYLFSKSGTTSCRHDGGGITYRFMSKSLQIRI